MIDLYRDDPDNLFSLDFVIGQGAQARADAAVASAWAQIDEGHGDTKIDAKRTERRKRLIKAFAGTDIINVAVAEFVSREEYEASRVNMPMAYEEAQALAQRVAELQMQLGKHGTALQLSETNEAGKKVAEGASVASAFLSDALRALLLAEEALKEAVPHAPANARGASGAMGRLRLSPDVALFGKLKEIWTASGLNTGDGESGDGMYVFMRHALKVVNPDRIEGGWEAALRKKEMREKSKSKQVLQEKSKT